MTLLDPRFWLAALVGTVLAFAAGYWYGEVSRGATDLAVQQKKALAEADQRREDARMQRQASAGFQTQLQQIQARAVGLQGKLHDALNKPIPTCPATVGDVIVPADALRVLRDAGQDPAP